MNISQIFFHDMGLKTQGFQPPLSRAQYILKELLVYTHTSIYTHTHVYVFLYIQIIHVYITSGDSYFGFFTLFVQ